MTFRSDEEGPIEPKSRAGTRTVFLLDRLRPLLEPLAGRHADPDALFFGLTAETPFEPKNSARKVKSAWQTANESRAGEELASLDPITLHEARPSFSTWLDHAGVSPARADRMMGHSDGSVAGRYRHQLPRTDGRGCEARRRLPLEVDIREGRGARGCTVGFPAARRASPRRAELSGLQPKWRVPSNGVTIILELRHLWTATGDSRSWTFDEDAPTLRALLPLLDSFRADPDKRSAVLVATDGTGLLYGAWNRQGAAALRGLIDNTQALFDGTSRQGSDWVELRNALRDAIEGP